MSRIFLAVLAMTALTCGFARAAADPLEPARQLYLAAAYEEALVSLAVLPEDADADQVDKLRALCLLALNRPDEASKALESLAMRRPLLKLDDSESPKLVRMFQGVRLRVLAPVAKSLYVAARGSYDKGQFETAKAQFSDLLAILSERELSKQAGIADLTVLADGFAKLVDLQIARQAPPQSALAVPAAAAANVVPVRASNVGSPGVVPVSQQPPAGAVPPPANRAPQPARPGAVATAPSVAAPTAAAPAAAGAAAIFTADDAGLVAPVPIEQRLPPWIAPPRMRNESFSGLIEVVIDEAGKVTSAVITDSVNAPYDRLLLQAARRWLYRPAQRDGLPVKFRRIVSVVLAPQPS